LAAGLSGFEPIGAKNAKRLKRPTCLGGKIKKDAHKSIFGSYIGILWGDWMLSLLVMFAACNLLYFALHVTSGGSFPKPLSQKEERECLEKIRVGDIQAKDRLIEHNLRLVAHIIKVCCYKVPG